MHIGYFINQYPAVSHSFIRREIQALESLGIQVSRFAIRPDRRDVIDEADKMEAGITKFIIQTPVLELMGITLRQMLFNGYALFESLFFACRYNFQYEKNLKKTLICFIEAMVLNEWAKKEGIQHIHCHFGLNSTTVALFACRLGGLHYSFTVHGPEEFDKPETAGLSEKIRQSRFVVAVSSFGRSQLCRWVSFKEWEKIHIIHCGLDEAFTHFKPKPVPDVSRLVCVGRLCEQKGQLLLLQTMLELVRQGVFFKLVLIGDGPMRGQIEDFIHEHHLSAHVELTGSLNSERIREELSLARAFVLPSFAEGLPVVIMEALAMGRPVISSYVAGIPELVLSGGNGWLIPAGSIHDLSSAIRSSLQSSTSRLTEMGDRGRERVLQRHDILTEAKKLKTLLSTVADHSR